MANAFTIGNVEFEAVQFTAPIKHWRPKIVETGEILEAGVFDGKSRPKLQASIQYFYDRICKNESELRRQLRLPEKQG